MGLDTDLADVVTASADQTKATEALTAEVQGKMGAIDTRSQQLDQNVQTFIANGQSLKFLHTKILDLSALDPTKFYPVVVPLSGDQSTEFRLFRSYYDGQTFMGLWLHCIVTGGTWGGNSQTTLIVGNLQTYQKACAAMGFMAHGTKYGFFLRGGSSYRMDCTIQNPTVQILDVPTRYYVQTGTENNIQYDLTAGPVDEATADLSDGALSLGPVYSVGTTVGVHTLGGHAGA